MSAVLYGIDVGTTSLKGIALDESGTVLSRAESGYPLITPERGWAEQNPEDWWSATETVLGKLRTGAGPPSGIGLTGQMHGLVALDSAAALSGSGSSRRSWSCRSSASESSRRL